MDAEIVAFEGKPSTVRQVKQGMIPVVCRALVVAFIKLRVLNSIPMDGRMGFHAG